MNSIISSTLKRITAHGLILATGIVSLAFQPFMASPAVAATLTPLWSAGGLSAGNDSAGQAARIATDAWGNVAVVSGPSLARDLAVTSYTADGIFRWRGAVSPSVGTFVGDWVAAAPNGDFVAVGRNVDHHGQPIAITLVRFASDGALQWRVDLARTIPWVARLVVDSGGNAYLAFNSVGDGQDIQLQKYDASGVLLWSKVISTGFFANDYATSLALSPDETDVVLTGDILGGATWITAAFNAVTGTRRWLVTAAEGIAALDVVVDATRVYVTGQGNEGINGFLTVVAYDRATGARLWRTDANPPTCCASGSRIALAPDGSLVVAGLTASGGYSDWWIVAMENSGTVRWQALRDAALSGDEYPTGVFVLPDGTTVVTGRGGPVIRDILGNQYWQGITAGYSSDGTLLWEGISKLATVWATSLPSGDVCATGGYDALITCWRPSGGVQLNQPPTAVMSATPSSGPAPLTVIFDGSGSTDPDGSVTSWLWSFGDGNTSSGVVVTHTYLMNGITYYPSLTVADNRGGSSWTSTIVTTTIPPPPATPSLLAASISGASVLLTWRDSSSNETGFSIERCEGAGCTSFAGLGDTPANVTTYQDSSVDAQATYRYRVMAYNYGGSSAYSNIASILTGVANQPPTAVMSAIPPTGAAPLTVTFSSAGSLDPDGAIASYSWSFGDGGTSTAANPSHTYTSGGVYVATLTVTDTSGASANKSVTITVAASASVLRSTNIALTATRLLNTVTATGTVTVKNQTGGVIPGATVSATWTLPNGTTKSQIATTNSSGIATFSVKSTRGTYTLMVSNIAKTGYTFDAANSVLTRSIKK